MRTPRPTYTAPPGMVPGFVCYRDLYRRPPPPVGPYAHVPPEVPVKPVFLQTQSQAPTIMAQGRKMQI